MQKEIPVFFRNELRCLSNAVLQSCLRLEVSAGWGILPLVRKLVTDNAISLEKIMYVMLHQCPQPDGIVNYLLSVYVEGVLNCFEMSFQGSGFNVPCADLFLYDRRRDGAVEYLHLQH